MAKKTLDIIIKLIKQGGGDKDTISALVNIKQAVMTAGAVMGTLAAAAYTVDRALDATVGKFVTYALAVSDGARVTGLSVEEYSRLVQASDDLRISQETLTKGLEYAIKQGFQPSAAWLGQMGDEILKLPPGAERSRKAIELFGKASGPELLRLLEQGSDGIEAMMTAVEDGLVVTEEGEKAALQYAAALDTWNDSAEALTNTIGQKALPLLADLFDSLNLIASGNWDALEDRYLAGLIKLGNTRIDFAPTIAGTKEAGNTFAETAIKVLGLTDALAALALEAEKGEGTEDLAVNFTELLGLTMNLQRETDTYNEKMDELTAKQGELAAKIGELEGKSYLTKAQKTELDDLKTELGEVETQIGEVATAHEEAGRRIVFSLLQAKLAVDGLEQEEYDMLIATAESFGLIDSKTADVALAISNLTTQFQNGKLTVDGYKSAIDRIMAGGTANYNVNVNTNYTYSGGSTGRRDQVNKEAEGGDYIVREPTLFMAGEAGPERATFTPMGGGMRDGGGGGMNVVNVYLDSRLIQRVLAEGLRRQGV